LSRLFASLAPVHLDEEDVVDDVDAGAVSGGVAGLDEAHELVEAGDDGALELGGGLHLELHDGLEDLELCARHGLAHGGGRAVVERHVGRVHGVRRTVLEDDLRVAKEYLVLVSTYLRGHLRRKWVAGGVPRAQKTKVFACTYLRVSAKKICYSEPQK